MAYGFKIVNENGYTQVDDTFESYVVYQTGSTTIGVNTLVTVPITNPGVKPLVFIRIRENNSNGVCTFCNASDFVLRTPASNSAAITIDWYTAVPARYGSTSGGYGLIVRNSSNVVVFDSRLRYFRVRQIFTDTLDTTVTTYTANAMPSGQKPYWCASLIQGWVAFIPNGINMTGYMNMVAQPSTNQLSMVQKDMGTGAAAGAYSDFFQLVVSDIPPP